MPDLSLGDVLAGDPDIGSETLTVEQLTYAVKTLAWLHAELEAKHNALVADLQKMIAQAMGPAGADPARAQAIRARAVNIARHRQAQALKGKT